MASYADISRAAVLLSFYGSRCIIDIKATFEEVDR